jgi:hypothetical protein
MSEKGELTYEVQRRREGARIRLALSCTVAT